MKFQNPARLPRNERHAVYANTAEGVTFRVGLPTGWDAAIARWYRLDDPRLYQGRTWRVRHARRWYTVESFEVRAVNRHGVGLGSERHARAIHVPYLACRVKPAAKKPARRLAHRLAVA